MTEQAQQVAQQAQEVVGQATDQAQELVGKAVDMAQGQLHTQANAQKDKLADSIDGVVQALQTTGQQMQQSNGMVAGWATKAGDQVGSVSTYLRQRDVVDLVDVVEDFARQKPTLFLGLCLATGFAAVRFLKSSRPTAQSQYGSQYDDSAYQGGRYSGTTAGSSNGQSTMGRYNMANPATGYEDVQGIPPVQRQYAGQTREV